ncbi:MAG: DUF5678 domain-containing protein [Candidatus Hydrothermarchaeales archaeon]
MASVKAYNAFMKANLTKYLGEWIAIADNEIVSHGKDIRAIYDQAKEKYPNARIMITKVPEKQHCIF